MAKKVGRNELCPCGSGLKYKHCHGSPQQEAEVAKGSQYATMAVIAGLALLGLAGLAAGLYGVETAPRGGDQARAQPQADADPPDDDGAQP